MRIGESGIESKPQGSFQSQERENVGVRLGCLGFQVGILLPVAATAKRVSASIQNSLRGFVFAVRGEVIFRTRQGGAACL